MSALILIFVGLVIGALAALVIVMFLKKNASAMPDPQNSALLLIQNQMGNFQSQLGNFMKTVDEKMGDSNKEMQQAVRMQ
jgi:flagellar basal body-associated protein FliL